MRQNDNRWWLPIIAILFVVGMGSWLLYGERPPKPPKPIPVPIEAPKPKPKPARPPVPEQAPSVFAQYEVVMLRCCNFQGQVIDIKSVGTVRPWGESWKDDRRYVYVVKYYDGSSSIAVAQNVNGPEGILIGPVGVLSSGDGSASADAQTGIKVGTFLAEELEHLGKTDAEVSR